MGTLSWLHSSARHPNPWSQAPLLPLAEDHAEARVSALAPGAHTPEDRVLQEGEAMACFSNWAVILEVTRG